MHCFFCFHLSLNITRSQSTTEGNQDRNLESGTEAEATNEPCLLAPSPRLAQLVYVFVFSCTAQNHLPRDGTAHCVLGPPTSIVYQENAPTACLQASQMEELSQMRFLLPR